MASTARYPYLFWYGLMLQIDDEWYGSDVSVVFILVFVALEILVAVVVYNEGHRGFGHGAHRISNRS